MRGELGAAAIYTKLRHASMSTVERENETFETGLGVKGITIVASVHVRERSNRLFVSVDVRSFGGLDLTLDCKQNAAGKILAT